MNGYRVVKIGLPNLGDVYLEIPDKMTLGPFIFNISPFIRILKKMYSLETLQRFCRFRLPQQNE